MPWKTLDAKKNGKAQLKPQPQPQQKPQPQPQPQQKISV
jgi:hypothetical protein